MKKYSFPRWLIGVFLLLFVAFTLGGGAAVVLSGQETPQPAGNIAEFSPNVKLQVHPPANEDLSPSITRVLAEPEPTATRILLPTPTLQPTQTPVPLIVVNPNEDNLLETVSVTADERWIDVDLSSQTLTAYEGATPVFTTLVSSGVRDHPTVTGQFRVWLRYESQTMDGRLLGFDYYLENVPYVM